VDFQANQDRSTDFVDLPAAMRLITDNSSFYVSLRVLVFAIIVLANGSPASADPSDVTASVSLEEKSVTQQEPILLSVAFENAGANEINFDLGADGEENIAITVSGPSGLQSKRDEPVRNGQTFFGKIQLRPGEKSVKTLILNRWFRFDDVGEYEIQISLDPSGPDGKKIANELKAKPLHIRVEGRNSQRLAMRCDRLLQEIQSEQSAEKKLAAMAALRYIRDPVAVPALLTISRRSDFGMEAVRALLAIGDPEAIHALLQVLRSSDGEVRAAAKAALQTLLTQVSDPAIAEEIRNALSEMEKSRQD
jgi:hypothetical protein